MRAIRKGKEPVQWLEFRSRAGATFDAADAPKGALRQALVREQAGICCYCMGRIRPGAASMKIEHWAAQSTSPDAQLTYTNLLAACLGNQGAAPSQQHCDTAKGDVVLHTHPADPGRDCTSAFIYSVNGEIGAALGDPRVRADIDTLRLNHPRLRAGRRALLDEVLREVSLTPGTRNADSLLRMAERLEQRDAEGDLRPYCQAAIYWLRRQATKR